MSDEISDPLLNLLHGQGMLDDLQFEEVGAEVKRSGNPSSQVLQDFSIFKLDDLLQVIAGALGSEVVSLKDREIPPEVVKLIPAKVAQMCKCLPVAVHNGLLQIAVAEPLNPQLADEIQFAAKRDIQIVVADPADVLKTVERLYGAEDTGGYDEILKELGRTRKSPPRLTRLRRTPRLRKRSQTRCRSSNL